MSSGNRIFGFVSPRCFRAPLPGRTVRPLHPILWRHSSSQASKNSGNKPKTGEDPLQSPTDFASFNISDLPSAAQLSFANQFFTLPATRPKQLLSSDKFKKLPPSMVPEVCFLGRANVGKSSLLNSLVQREKMGLAAVSKRPGCTTRLEAYGVGGVVVRGGKPRPGNPQDIEFETWSGSNGLVIVDMPGYGSGSQEEWGIQIMKYLENRKQLRKAFVLTDARIGLKQTDLMMLRLLARNGVPYQLIITKIDKVKKEKLSGVFKQLRTQITEEAGRYKLNFIDDLIACSSKQSFMNNRIGIDLIRWSILSASGFECDQEGSSKFAAI